MNLRLSRKKLIFSILVLILMSFFIINFVEAATLTSDCVVKSGPCQPGTEVALFKVSGNQNAHAELISQANYNSYVCCSGNNLANSCSVSSSSVLLKLSSTTNAHVEQNDQGNYNNNVCLSTTDNTPVICDYANDCDVLGSSFKCIVEISDVTNAHVGDCSSPYTKKVCCSLVATGGSVPARMFMLSMPTTIPANGVSTSTITATLLDSNNRAVQGATIDFTKSIIFGGGQGTLAPTSAVTNNYGQARVTFRSAVSATNIFTYIEGKYRNDPSIQSRTIVWMTVPGGGSPCVLSNAKIMHKIDPYEYPIGATLKKNVDVRFKVHGVNCQGKTINFEFWDVNANNNLPVDNINGEINNRPVPEPVTFTSNDEDLYSIWKTEYHTNALEFTEDSSEAYEYKFKAKTNSEELFSDNWIRVNNEDGSECGDGNLDPGEICDTTIPGGLICQDFDAYTGGQLRCIPKGYPNQCHLDFSQCTGGTSGTCGNNNQEANEECDGTDLGTLLTCGAIPGFDPGCGSLSCNIDCTLNTNQCRINCGGGTGPVDCGDGDIEGNEVCDPPGRACRDYPYLRCASDCKSCFGIDADIKTVITRTRCTDDGNGDDVGSFEETITRIDIRTNQPVGAPQISNKECTLVDEVDIPFFTTLNIVIFLFLVSIYYFFVRKNKKHHRKA